MDHMFGGVIGLLVLVFLFVLAVLWFVLPFAIFGVKGLLRELIAEQRATKEAVLNLAWQVHNAGKAPAPLETTKPAG